MRTPSLLALTVALLALAAAPATAESWSGRDAGRDVRAYDIAVSQNCEKIILKDRLTRDRRRDIRRLSVDHGAASVVVTLALREVARRDKETSYDVVLRTPSRVYGVQAYPGPGQRTAVDFATLRPVRDPECGTVLETEEQQCPGLVTDVDRHADSVTFTIPRACLGEPRWVRAGALAGGVPDPLPSQGDVVTVTADAWGPRGSRLTTTLPPVGRKVHAG